MSKSALAVRSQAIKTGFFVVGTSLVLLLISIQLGGFSFKDRDEYGAVFTDASGLKSGDSVRVAGVEVGKVSNVAPYENTKAKVTFTVDTSRPIYAGTLVVVRYKNLTGDRYLELRQGPGEQNALRPGGVIPVAQTQPALDLDVLLAGFHPLFEGLAPDQFNQFSSELISVLQGEGGTIDSILTRTASLTSTLADRDVVIGQVVDNLNAVLGSLDSHSDRLGSTIDNLQHVVSGLSEDRTRLGASFDTASTLTARLSDLLTDLREPFAGMVHELGRTATTLNEGSKTIDSVLSLLPGDYLRVARLGSLEATYSLYICSLRLKLTGTDGQPIYTPWIGPSDNVERCKPGVAPLETPAQREQKAAAQSVSASGSGR